MALERPASVGKISPEVSLEKASDKESIRRVLTKKFPEFAAAPT